jgi:hypothetical protein
MFDLDGSGKINSLELKTVLGQLAHQNIPEVKTVITKEVSIIKPSFS